MSEDLPLPVLIGKVLGLYVGDDLVIYFDNNGETGHFGGELERLAECRSLNTGFVLRRSERRCYCSAKKVAGGDAVGQDGNQTIILGYETLVQIESDSGTILYQRR